MSKNVEKASAKGQDEQASAFVYDFLYHDSRRVGSFLSQLDQNGLLKEVKQSEHVAKGAKRGFSVNLGGNLPLAGGGNVGMEMTPKEGGGESLERVYDPFWANACELLDALEANGLIARDVSKTHLGGVVLVSGALNMIDLGLLQALWGLPTVQKKVMEGAQEDEPEPFNRQDRRAKNKQNRNKSEPVNEDVQLMLEILPILPHSLNIVMQGAGASSWASLEPTSMVGSSSDLLLKHGDSIPGVWHMLGILDARPDVGSLDDAMDDGAAFSLDLLSGTQNFIGQISNALAPMIRLLLGRPVVAYGVTPLLIFRQVNK